MKAIIFSWIFSLLLICQLFIPCICQGKFLVNFYKQFLEQSWQPKNIVLDTLLNEDYFPQNQVDELNALTYLLYQEEQKFNGDYKQSPSWKYLYLYVDNPTVGILVI